MYHNKNWLKQKYFKEGLLIREIAVICGVQRATIEKWFLKHKLKGRSPSLRHRGKWNGRWNGGKQIHKGKSGDYILVSVNGKRVREHRLVMEQILNRKLLPEETVHHKDGNTLNNKPNNLLLFSSRSKHQRYEDTLNTFAKQILFGDNKPKNYLTLLSLFNKLLSKNSQNISI